VLALPPLALPPPQGQQRVLALPRLALSPPQGQQRVLSLPRLALPGLALPPRLVPAVAHPGPSAP
jgi:hypothetical protein